MHIDTRHRVKRGIALFQDKQRTTALLRNKLDSGFYALLTEHCTGKLHGRITRTTNNEHLCLQRALYVTMQSTIAGYRLPAPIRMVGSEPGSMPTPRVSPERSPWGVTETSVQRFVTRADVVDPRELRKPLQKKLVGFRLDSAFCEPDAS